MHEGDTPETFGAVIKERRIELGITQVQLAQSVGRSPSTVRSWERDRTVPQEEKVLRSMADVLELPDAEVFELAGIPVAVNTAGSAEPDLFSSDVDTPDGQDPEGGHVEGEDEVVDEGIGSEPDSPATDAGDEPVVVDADEMPTMIDFRSEEEDLEPHDRVDEVSDVGDEPTAVLVADRAERLLGVATASAIEFVAEPRFLEPDPEETLVTEPEPREPEPVPVASNPMTETAISPVPTTADRPAQGQARTQTLTRQRPVGPNSYLEDPREIRGYRIRAAFTVAGMLVLLYAGLWAWRGFRESFTAILDGLITGF